MTPTPPSPSVREVAEKLTEAQRYAMLVELAVDGEPAISYFTGAGCRCALQRKGLVVDRMYETKLTPLGLAVRQALLSLPEPAQTNMENEK